MTYTDADVELVANAYHRTTSRACSDPRECPGVQECVYAEHSDWDGFRAGVAALVADGWRPNAIRSTIEQAKLTRAAVAEEIAQAIEAYDGPLSDGPRTTLARIARECGEAGHG
jgi:hypothetical protein